MRNRPGAGTTVRSPDALLEGRRSSHLLASDRARHTRLATFAILYGYVVLLLAIGRYAPDFAGLALFVLIAHSFLSVPLVLTESVWSTYGFLLLTGAISGIFILAAGAGLPLKFADHTDFRILMLAVPALTLLVSVIRKESGRPILGGGGRRENDWTSIRASGVMLIACAPVFALTDVVAGGAVSWSSLFTMAAMGLTVFLFGIVAPMVADRFAPKWGTRETSGP